MTAEDADAERANFLDTYLYNAAKTVTIHCNSAIKVPKVHVEPATSIGFSLVDNRVSRLAARIKPMSGSDIDVQFAPDASPPSRLNAQITQELANIGFTVPANSGQSQPLRRLQVSLIQANARIEKRNASYGLQGKVDLIMRVVDAENNVLWSKRITSVSFFETFSRGTSFSVAKSINSAYCDASNQLSDTWPSLLPYLDGTQNEAVSQ